jgi:hypothetical protein
MKSKKKSKMSNQVEKLLEKAWKDPLVQEYFEKQKKLFESTLRKAIRRAKKNLEDV